jgi:AcrR family transcriptional regulator
VTAPADRRARKKAQTRAEVLRTAQALFAERGFDAVTISDIATAADVAVQTVFNHFAGKEELFFADRMPWLDGPADAVRHRPEGVAPLAALRAYSTDLVAWALEQNGSAERRALVATLQASPALRAALPAVHQQAERRLAAALAAAWQDADEDADRTRVAASLAAALWIAGARALLTELSRLPEGAGAAEARAAVEDLAKRLFDRLETGLVTLLELPAG